jgi:hypothetical protein
MMAMSGFMIKTLNQKSVMNTESPMSILTVCNDTGQVN